MDWDALDVAVFGAMVLGVGVVYALARRKSRNLRYRSAVGVALAAAFLLIWINGAVGIIGHEGNPANLMFLGVLGVGAAGAAIVRFEPRGMMRALVATAFAQLAVAVVALFGGLGAASHNWPYDVLAITAFFVLLWLFSAWLFRNAAVQELLTT